MSFFQKTLVQSSGTTSNAISFFDSLSNDDGFSNFAMKPNPSSSSKPTKSNHVKPSNIGPSAPTHASSGAQWNNNTNQPFDQPFNQLNINTSTANHFSSNKRVRFLKEKSPLPSEQVKDISPLPNLPSVTYQRNILLEQKLQEAEQKFQKLQDLFLIARSNDYDLHQAALEILSKLLNNDLILIPDDIDRTGNATEGKTKIDYLISFNQLFVELTPVRDEIESWGYK